MVISAEATAINMTNLPKLPVEEGSEVQYACETDYAYPDPPFVQWFVNDEAVLHNIHTKEYHASPGDKRMMTKSTIRLVTKRDMNNKQVKCVLKNDDTILDKHCLNVMCKYLL